jgi:hypothetical protein
MVNLWLWVQKRKALPNILASESSSSKKPALEKGYTRLAVIAAIGTRQYYQSRGFERGELYMLKPLG